MVTVDIVSWAELVRRLGGRRPAYTAVTTGDWWRVLHGWYAPRLAPDGPVTRLAALRRALPPDVVVSHRAALWLLGLDALRSEIDVSVPRGRHLRARVGIVPHTAALPDSEVCEIGGLLVTSAARAVVDIARAEPLAESVATGDLALRAGATTVPLLEESLERAAHLRGVHAARVAIPHLDGRSESQMESRFRVKLVTAGLPRPATQYDIYDRDGHVARADMWLDGVVIEYDGRLEARAQAADRRRHTRMDELGCVVRRYTAADYYQRAGASLVAELRRALVAAAVKDRSAVCTGPDTLPRPRLRPLPTRAARRAA